MLQIPRDQIRTKRIILSFKALGISLTPSEDYTMNASHEAGSNYVKRSLLLHLFPFKKKQNTNLIEQDQWNKIKQNKLNWLAFWNQTNACLCLSQSKFKVNSKSSSVYLYLDIISEVLWTFDLTAVCGPVWAIIWQGGNWLLGSWLLGISWLICHRTWRCSNWKLICCSIKRQWYGCWRWSDTTKWRLPRRLTSAEDFIWFP